jgi:hypothetical protein
MRRLIFTGLVCCGVAFAACGDDTETKKPENTGGDGGSGGTAGMGGGAPEPLCGTANLPLDEAGLTELSFDDDLPESNLRLQTFEVSLNSTYVFNDAGLVTSYEGMFDTAAVAAAITP